MPDQSVFHPRRWVLLLFLALAMLGAFTFVVGLLVEPQRTWANVLLVSTYLIGLSTGSLVLIALLYVTGARWSAPLLRLPEALALRWRWARLVHSCQPRPRGTPRCPS